MTSRDQVIDGSHYNTALLPYIESLVLPVQPHGRLQRDDLSQLVDVQDVPQ